MILGLPFPTYLGWFATPICIVGTTIYCVAVYKKYLKSEK